MNVVISVDGIKVTIWKKSKVHFPLFLLFYCLFLFLYCFPYSFFVILFLVFLLFWSIVSFVLLLNCFICSSVFSFVVLFVLFYFFVLLFYCFLCLAVLFFCSVVSAHSLEFYEHSKHLMIYLTLIFSFSFLVVHSSWEIRRKSIVCYVLPNQQVCFCF